MELTNISTVKSLMSDETFKKKYGQNFLINPLVPEKIAEAGYSDGVLEIGPGIGTLTCELAKRSKKVVAIEIDTNLIPILEKTLEEYDNIKVINADAMKINIAEIIKNEFEGMEVSVCANLPYYITSPIIMMLLESGVRFKKITVMVQKEFADRITSKAGSDEYGSITAACAYYGKAKKLFGVPSSSFLPRPKVDSAVISIEIYDNPPVDCDKDTLFKVIRAAFAQRRKTLANSLSSIGISKSDSTEIIRSCGFKEDIRGEKLDIYAYSEIAKAISKLNK